MSADGRSGVDRAAVAVTAPPYPCPRAAGSVATFSTDTTPRLVNANPPLTPPPPTAPPGPRTAGRPADGPHPRSGDAPEHAAAEQAPGLVRLQLGHRVAVDEDPVV